MRSLLRVALLSAWVGSSALAAEPSAPAADFLRTISRAPALNAATQRMEAARARIDAAGRLPDPEVEAMGSRMTGPMNARATMWELNVRQPLPKRGERAADRERARAGLAMTEADYALMTGEMAADTAMALAEAAGAEQRIHLLELQLARFDALLRAIEIQLSTGTRGRLADRLTVQTRVASMQLMVEESRRMANDALADARGRLGLAPDAPLPEFAAPAATDIDVERAAEIQLAAARAQEASAMLKMAHASANPMTAVGLRLERERTAMGNDDTIGLAVMSEIPWRSRRYARAEAKAAQADRAAAEIDATAVRYRIAAALTRVERADRLAAVARRLGQDTLGRLDAEYDAMIRSASAASMGESTMFQTVEVLEKATEAQLQIIEAETAARVARAELWRYLAADDFLNLIL
jgi:outer membrane protein, heavy metal efflux system